MLGLRSSVKTLNSLKRQWLHKVSVTILTLNDRFALQKTTFKELVNKVKRKNRRNFLQIHITPLLRLPWISVTQKLALSLMAFKSLFGVTPQKWQRLNNVS